MIRVQEFVFCLLVFFLVLKAQAEEKVINAIVTTESVIDDPLLAKGYQQFQILGLMADTLVQKQGPFKFASGIASRWDISETQKKYTFHIGDQGTFSDGSQIRAEDVVISFKRHLNVKPLTATGTYLDIILDSVSVGPQNSVVFRLKGPYPNFLEIISMPGFGIFKESSGKVLGSGPFTIESHKEKSWCLKRRASYSGKIGKFDKICFAVERDIEKSIQLLATGKIDLAIGSPLEVVTSEKIAEKNISSAAFSMVTTQIFINFRNPVLREKNNRISVARELYRSRDNPDFLTKFDKPLNSFFPFGILSSKYYAAADARAKKIISSIPKKFKGDKLKIVFPYGIFKQTAVDKIINDLKSIGFNVEAINVKGKEYVDPIVKNDFDILFMPYLGIISDPDGFVDILNPRFLGGNLTTPTSKILSNIEKIRFTENEDSRIDAYEKIFGEFEEELLMIPFSQNSIPIVTSKRLKIPDLNFNFLNLRDIDFE